MNSVILHEFSFIVLQVLAFFSLLSFCLLSFVICPCLFVVFVLFHFRFPPCGVGVLILVMVVGSAAFVTLEYQSYAMT